MTSQRGRRANLSRSTTRSVGRAPLDRNAPSLWNAVHERWLGWDGAADSLWSQALRPLLDARELGSSAAHLRRRVAASADWSCRWRAAFGSAPPDDDDRLLVQTGKVGPHIDLETCTRLGIAVADGVGSPVAPAELTWALIMASMRRLPQYIGNLKHGAWQQSGLKTASMPPNFGIGQVLRGRHLGIWGYGRIGQIVAGYGRAFGMRVSVWGSESARTKALADGHEAANSCEGFFEQCDVLSVHLRLSERTQGIIALEDLSRMKPTALFVNTSRAELLKEHALVSALNRGRPGMAAIDVFEAEPILQGHPLLRLENAVCTPHIGYVEQDSYEMYFSAAFDNVVNFVANNPTNIVNPDALKVLR